MSELSLNDVLPQTEGIALKEHFDEFSHEYDAIIKRAFPDYQEAFETLFYFTEPSCGTPKILELGVGTGNLTLRALKSYPKAHYTLLDLSDEMLVQTANKLSRRNSENYTLIQKGFKIPDLKMALNFAIEFQPKEAFEYINRKLPFGCHAPLVHDKNFWKEHIPGIRHVESYQ